MNLLRHYKQIILLICLAGVVATAAMRVNDISHFALSLFDACMPLIVGFCMAFILNIVVVRFERILWPKHHHKWLRHARRPVALLLSLLAVGLFLGFVIWLAVPQLAHSLGLILTAVPVLYSSSMDFINQHMDIIPGVTPDTIVNTIQGQSWVGNLSEWGSNGGTYIVKTLGTAAEWVFNAFIGLFFAVYILLDKEKLQSQSSSMAKAYIKPAVYKKLT
ncbi:MAG: AI-2E family transporter, partial [Veillonella sp.]|nr:AI-2E family transporter [Veillonella sp.]